MAAPSIDKVGAKEDQDLISFSPNKPSPNSEDLAPNGVSLYMWLRPKEQSSRDARKTSKTDAARKTKGDSESADDDDPDYHQRLLDNDSFCAPQTPVNLTCSGSASHYNSSAPSVIGQAPLTDPFVDDSFCSEPDMVPYREPGCAVTIYNLPVDITMRDIFSRISTGEVRNAFLSEMPQNTPGLCAIVIFKDVRAAVEFVHNSRDFDNIWEFCIGTDEISWTQRARIEHIPNLVTGKLLNRPDNFGAVELRSFAHYDNEATRCLCIENCAFEVIPEIWDALGLAYHLKSPHYAHNLEDIWVDGFRTGEDGRIGFTELHIWFTCEALATGMIRTVSSRFRRIPRHHWARGLIYEKDPCGCRQPYDTFFRPSDDPGFAWNRYVAFP